jgi:hypothetical protein
MVTLTLPVVVEASPEEGEPSKGILLTIKTVPRTDMASNTTTKTNTILFDFAMLHQP